MGAPACHHLCGNLRVKSVHVVPHLDDEAAGPSQSVLRLCEALAQQGQEVDLHTIAAKRAPLGVNLILHKEWALPKRFGFSLELVGSLQAAAAAADVVHNHSLWSFPNMAAGLATRAGGAKLVTSPRGTLAPAARSRSKLKKKVFRPMQWPAISRAACLHATSPMEYQDVREFGLKQPVAVIPNGIDVPRLDSEALPANQHRRLLFLGRLHPIKGIELLLTAWRALQDCHPDWEIVIAGKGELEYVRSLHDLAKFMGLKRISFPGPVYGEDKRALYCSAHLFVLPTQTENFGMAIAEAQAHGVPVITTKGAPWSGLVSKRSGWWVDRTQDEIEVAMDEALNMDEESLRGMGSQGLEWMKADFDWQSVAAQMSGVYKWLRDGGETPQCVRLD